MVSEGGARNAGDSGPPHPCAIGRGACDLTTLCCPAELMNLMSVCEHLGRCSAVDGDLRPGDVAALVGEQECHQLRNLLRRSVAVHRHLLHPLLALLGRTERDHVGVDWTGMNRVPPDFAAAEVA